MAYTTESGVYDRTGFSSSIIQTLSGKTSAEVTTLITAYISDAQQRIREDIEYPINIKYERHFGDGNKNIFSIGPEDDPFAEEGDYDPEDGLVEIYNLWTGNLKRQKPYPEDCELGTESATGWTGSVAVTVDTSENVHGTNAIKAVFTAANQYIQYPDMTNVDYLDKIVDTWADHFFYMKLSDATATITVRLYDKDGNYAEETISPRQNNIGQYVWLELDSFDSVLDWDDVRVQYIRFYTDKACTIYLDNMCFADEWAFTAPEGKFHIEVADNVANRSAPSYGYPFYVSYSYDPFLASVPRNIKEAAEWIVGVYIIDYLRGIKYRETDFDVFGESLEAATPFQRGGLLGVRTNMLKNYEDCLMRWGGGAYGIVG